MVVQEMLNLKDKLKKIIFTYNNDEFHVSMASS